MKILNSNIVALTNLEVLQVLLTSKRQLSKLSDDECTYIQAGGEGIPSPASSPLGKSSSSSSPHEDDISSLSGLKIDPQSLQRIDETYKFVCSYILNTKPPFHLCEEYEAPGEEPHTHTEGTHGELALSGSSAPSSNTAGGAHTQGALFSQEKDVEKIDQAASGGVHTQASFSRRRRKETETSGEELPSSSPSNATAVSSARGGRGGGKRKASALDVSLEVSEPGGGDGDSNVVCAGVEGDDLEAGEGKLMKYSEEQPESSKPAVRTLRGSKHNDGELNFQASKAAHIVKVLSERFGFTSADILQIINLSAYRQVEVYSIVTNCSQRFRDDQVDEICEILSQVFQTGIP